jgi:hypothetical protein
MLGIGVGASRRVTAIFSISVTAQVAPARNLLTRDSAYESTYP